MNSNIVNIIPTITGFIKYQWKISYAMFITISTLFVKVSVL